MTVEVIVLYSDNTTFGSGQRKVVKTQNDRRVATSSPCTLHGRQNKPRENIAESGDMH